MNQNSGPQDPRELLGAYALGAVGADDRATVEHMLLEDAEARNELHGLEHAVAWLAHASPRPSTAAWDAVAAEVRRDLATDSAAAPPADAPVRLDERRTERRGRAEARRRPFGPIALALAVAAVTLAVILVVRPGDGNGGADTVALRDGRGRTVVLLRMVSGDRGEVVRSDLPPAPTGRELQLWAAARSGGPMRSAGVLGRSLTDGRRVTIPRDAGQLAISVEPAGGSAAPTTAPVASGPID